MLILKGNLIDATGTEMKKNALVAIEEEKIIYVGDADKFQYPEKSTVMDVGSGTIMPGFIDQHIHFGIGSVDLTKVYLRDDIQKAMLSVYELNVMLNAGFTSVRETGGISTSFEEALSEGWIKGPRLFSAGKMITQTGGHADFIQNFPIEFTKMRATHTRIADGIDDCRRAAREQFRSGAKFLKIMTTGGITSQGDGNRESQFSIDEIKVFVEEADMHDTYVSAHAQGTAGIKNALLGGVKSIEHGIFMDDECIELMLKNDAYLVPTFTIVNSYLDNRDILPPWILEKLLASNEEHFLSAQKCFEAGVKIGLGSDLSNDPKICPFGTNGREFLFLTKIGMSPMQAIIAGTKTGAELMKRKDLGTIVAGKLADLCVCIGNPIENIELLANPENIKIVIQNGKIVKNTIGG